jgi:hypothetical protein
MELMLRYGLLLILILCGCSLEVLPVETPTVPPVLPMPPTLTPAPPTPPIAEMVQGECLFSAYGIGGVLSIYASPDGQSEIVGETEQGRPPLEVVSIGGYWEAGPHSGQWYEVVLPDGGTGWITDIQGGVSGDCDF